MNIGATKNQETGEELLMNFGVAWNGCWTSPGTCSRWRSFVSRQFVWRTTWQAEWWRVIGRVRLESGYHMMCLIFKSPLVLEWYFERSNCNVKKGQFEKVKVHLIFAQCFPLRPSKSKGWKSKKHQQIGHSRCRIFSDLASSFSVFFLNPWNGTLKI